MAVYFICLFSDSNWQNYPKTCVMEGFSYCFESIETRLQFSFVSARKQNLSQRQMFKKNVFTFRSLPVEEGQRKLTDCICTIIGGVFALTLFILACCLFTKNNFYVVNYPVDDTGSSCFYDQQDAPFLYFQNINDLTANKYCVTVCPRSGEGLQCSAKHSCPGQVSGYDTRQTMNELGGFCLPIESALEDKFWSNPLIANKEYLIKGYTAIGFALLIGLCVGILYLVAVVLAPKVITNLVFVLAFLALGAVGVLMIVQPINMLEYSGNFWNVAFGVLFLVVSLCIFIFYFCYREEIEVGAIFMAYSNQFLKETPQLLLYILLFLVLSAGLVVLCVWQYIAFGTISTPYLTKGDLYFSSAQNILLQVLNLIEFIWGIQFLRDAFNYIVSGNTVQWYFNFNSRNESQCSRPFSRLIFRNFGSVVAGSFLNAFFNIFGIILDIFRCNPKGTCGKAFKCCRQSCQCLTCLFDFVRADAYAYIHLTGIPYCNAAVQCEALCDRSHLFTSNQSCIRLYRISAQIFLVSLTSIIVFFLLAAKTSYASFIILGLIVCTSYLAVTYFADIHSNGAEGLVICYLTERNLEGANLQVCPLNLRTDIYDLEQRRGLTGLAED